MKVNLKKIGIAGSMIFMISLTGCTSNSKDSSKDILSDIGIVEKIEDSVFSKDESVVNIKKYIVDNISSVKDIELSSSMVNTFIYSLYSNLEKYISTVGIIKEDLLALEKEVLKTEVTLSNIKDIPEDYKLVKGFLEEIKDNYYNLFKKDGVYIVDVDLTKIREDFSKSLNEDTKRYLDFRINEDSVEIYNFNSDSYNIENVIKMFNEVVKNMKNEVGEIQRSNWLESLNYYMNILTSTGQNTFLSSDGKIKSDIFNEMKSVLDRLNLENESKAFVNDYLDIVKKNDMNVNSDNVKDYVKKAYATLDKFSIAKK